MTEKTIPQDPGDPQVPATNADDERIDPERRQGGPAGPDDVADDSRAQPRRSGDMDRPEMDPTGEETGEP